MLLKKASEEVKKEADERASDKSTFISKNVADLDMASLDQEALIELCEDLHDQLVCAEADKFDMEVVVRRQDMEVEELTFKANEAKGRFVKPTLKKVEKKNALTS